MQREHNGIRHSSRGLQRAVGKVFLSEPGDERVHLQLRRRLHEHVREVRVVREADGIRNANGMRH